MTTIAADLRAGVMCADSCWTDGESVGPLRKVFRVRGELIGLCGSTVYWPRWLEAWRGDPLAVHAGLRGVDTVALLLNDQALMTWDGTNGWTRIEEPRFAVGSGGHAARGALLAGASCRDAVAIACRVDAKSRAPVRSYRL